MPGLANALNSLAVEEGTTHDFSLFIWGIEIFFGVLFSVYAGLMLLVLDEPSRDLEYTIKMVVNFLYIVMILLLVNFSGTQLV